MPTSKFHTLKPSGETSYLLVINGKPEGPYTVEELKDQQIKFNDFVRSAEMDDYKEAHEVAELRELLGFSTQHIIPQYFAGFDQRLLASMLDWFMIFCVFILLGFIAILLVKDNQTQIIIAFSLLGIMPLVKIIYHIIMESSAKQATYGKQILKIKVCDMQGERISVGRSVCRNCAKLLSVLTLFTGYLFSFFNRQQQCLHDMVAKTLVIKDRLI
ncbi:Uncharacterized membrane protein YckC, RDD family [Mucilaginibacter mallensis]|uniref:Uncharacterized membrane protein YckC, RDD family n=1 Tax=Mucilaginibacter mallensis TaxID=652787 RepID=A0A1H2B8N3_MUCMA|nr:RDD family protein [Mucilaginibacter mallensis]SDT54558.1 Uncharacterized membrane protein YckC, RDD family [Mucilaginibacter mallensis]